VQLNPALRKHFSVGSNTNMTVDISKLIDKRNESLWDEINSKYQVDLQPSSNSEYACYSKSNTVTFFVPTDNYCPDSFTHELLHVYIRLKEVYIGSNLILRINSSRVLQRVFNDRLLEHVSNCLDHIKMLPVYLGMGFGKDKFLLDYYDNKCTDYELANIKRYYKNGNRFNSQAVETFIGKFFAVKADPNDSYDYLSCLTKLKKIDEKLYKTLDDFVISWQNYDLDSTDIFNSYRNLVDKLYEELKAWMTNKEFT
jgi:hypothetical protein